MAGFGSLYPDDVNAALPEAYADPSRGDFITNAVGSLLSLPKRAIQNSQQSLDTGNYDPATSVETALATVGGPLPWAEKGAVGAAGGKLVQPSKPLVASSEHALPYHDLLEPPSQLAYNALHGYPDAKVPAAATDQAAGNVGGGVAGASGGGEGLQQAIAQAERRAAGRSPLPGLPTREQIVDGELFTPGPVGSVHDVADRYMADKNFGSYFKTPEKYHELDPEHSAAIAQAFDEMKHAPNDPAVKASYNALVKETLAQYQAIKESGLKITPADAETYPYHGNPRAVAKDVADNNHMAFFKTDQGFGSDPTSGINLKTHPMMQPSGETLNGAPLLNNDLFRIVHDYFGHIKNGYGFRAAGEDNAWRAHAAMYSDLARPAMTTETRGQNSWVNYGPHGASNRTASGADTIYADQKVGLMPEWTMRDRTSPQPIIAYHGSPHTFDQFDPSKIGTGEGAQSYGHGLYFAENPKVAKMYRDQLAQGDRFTKNGVVTPWHHVADDLVTAIKGARAARDFPDSMPLHPDQTAQMVQYLTRMMEGGKSIASIKRNYTPPVGLEPEWNAALDAASAYKYNPKPGASFQVAIDHPPEHFLDWDKPLSEQPQVLAKLRGNSKHPEDWVPDPSMTGRKYWASIQGSPADRANFLRNTQRGEAGPIDIPGIRYLDAGSRGKKKNQTYNYVTFDAPRILKRYAVPGAIGATGFGSLAPGEERQ